MGMNLLDFQAWDSEGYQNRKCGFSKSKFKGISERKQTSVFSCRKLRGISEGKTKMNSELSPLVHVFVGNYSGWLLPSLLSFKFFVDIWRTIFLLSTDFLSAKFEFERASEGILRNQKNQKKSVKDQHHPNLFLTTWMKDPSIFEQSKSRSKVHKSIRSFFKVWVNRHNRLETS